MKELSIRALQLRELEILKNFDIFCRKHNLKYCLAYGTLLGTVRHKGFIPWDDDVDVFMPRPDYEAFHKLYDSKYVLKSPLNDNKWPLPMAKLMDMSIKVREGSLAEGSTGVWIDIFPLDGWPSKESDSKRFHCIHSKILLLNSLQRIRFVKSPHGNTRTIIKFALTMVSRLVPQGVYSRWLNKRSREMYPYVTSSYVGCSVMAERIMGRYEKEIFEDLIELKFEDSYFFAPRKYDLLLSTAYGDYMKLPPESERQNHKMIILED